MSHCVVGKYFTKFKRTVVPSKHWETLPQPKRLEFSTAHTFLHSIHCSPKMSDGVLEISLALVLVKGLQQSRTEFLCPSEHT